MQGIKRMNSPSKLDWIRESTSLKKLMGNFKHKNKKSFKNNWINF